jgi:hypothetical protein
MSTVAPVMYSVTGLAIRAISWAVRPGVAKRYSSRLVAA